ncbi:MAG: hypothetical protein LBO69_08045 [Ignavibacteria bacterium]|jgi:glycosyltransferase involved in cell wall biosynthesis|nr:hypothetical protein [Ignavibacteria bacterium]
MSETLFDAIKNINEIQPSHSPLRNIRKVLVIAYYFPPLGLSGVQRTLKFVRYLPDYDWQPIVLTTGATNYYAFDETMEKEVAGTLIYRTEKDPINPSKNPQYKTAAYPSRFMQKTRQIITQTLLVPDSRIKWKKYAVATGSKIIEEHKDINLIFATAPPFTDFLVAKELSLRYDIPFVTDYRDLWTDNPQYFFPTPLHHRKHLNLETDVLKFSRKTFVITRAMKEKLLGSYHFLNHNDIAIVPHGYDEADFSPRNIRPDGKKFVITHCGLFPDSRTPKYFLKALNQFLSKQPEARKFIEARFVGIMKKEHINLINRYKLSDVCKFTGYLPHKESVMQLLESDVLWMMLRNNIETPGRFYEYIGARKTMLICIPKGSISEIAEESNASLIAKPTDVADIEKKISILYDLWKQHKLPTPSVEFIQNYERKELTKRLAREISFVAKD